MQACQVSYNAWLGEVSAASRPDIPLLWPFGANRHGCSFEALGRMHALEARPAPRSQATIVRYISLISRSLLRRRRRKFFLPSRSSSPAPNVAFSRETGWRGLCPAQPVTCRTVGYNAWLDEPRESEAAGSICCCARRRQRARLLLRSGWADTRLGSTTRDARPSHDSAICLSTSRSLLRRSRRKFFLPHALLLRHLT